jgi:enoyl-CoA hydratase/carnithine racemase
MTERTSDAEAVDSPVLVEDRTGIRLISFNRPGARNALTSRCYRLLAEALDGAVEDRHIACALITGVGDVFSAGLDLHDDELSPESQWEVYNAFLERLESFPKPLIAAVPGIAVGIGTTMLGHFDLVFAARSARFRLPFAALGLAPEAGSTLTLTAAMGPQPTAHALFTGAWMSAEEAASAGLVWRLVDDEELLAVAMAECEEIAEMPVGSLVATKRLLLANRLPQVRAARRREEEEFRRLQAGPDHAEALAAFAERRKPRFSSARSEAS